MDAIKSNIQTCLPDIPDEDATQLADYLHGNDFTSVADLKLVQMEDIRDMVSLGRCRKLLSYWGRDSAVSATSSSAEATSSAGPSSSSSRATSSFSAGSSRQPFTLHDEAKRLNSVQLPTFTVESAFMPAAVRAAIKAGQRAPSGAREDMVQRIVDHCRETVPGFERQDLDTVAKQLVSLYPNTFKDTLPLSEHGSDGLAKQMKTNLDNHSRVKNFTANERQAPNSKEAFGCVRWNPLLEEGETLESQESIRELLLNMHKLTKKQWQWKEIRSNMERSFYLQRKDINGGLASAAVGKKNKKRKRGSDGPNDLDDPTPVSKGMPIAEVKERWPFVFTSKGMNYHFRMLTGQDFKDLLSKFSSEVVTMVEYLACKGEEFARLKRRLDRADRAGRADAKFIGLLLMLIKFFKENINYLVTFVDDVTTLDEIPNESLPTSQTPILVAAGSNLFNAQKYFVFIDNNSVASMTDFPDALSLVFCSYFTFSIEYPVEIASVLIFIQRVISKINALGTKSKNFKTACEKVTKFYNKYTEYKEKVNNEENEVL